MNLRGVNIAIGALVDDAIIRNTPITDLTSGVINTAVTIYLFVWY